MRVCTHARKTCGFVTPCLRPGLRDGLTPHSTTTRCRADPSLPLGLPATLSSCRPPYRMSGSTHVAHAMLANVAGSSARYLAPPCRAHIVFLEPLVLAFTAVREHHSLQCRPSVSMPRRSSSGSGDPTVSFASPIEATVPSCRRMATGELLRWWSAGPPADPLPQHPRLRAACLWTTHVPDLDLAAPVATAEPRSRGSKRERGFDIGCCYGTALVLFVRPPTTSSPAPPPPLLTAAAEDEFQDLCFDFGLELDDVVSALVVPRSLHTS